MCQLIVNVSKTPTGYSASCDLIPGWIVAYNGDFEGFENYLRESIDFYVECAIEDGVDFPPILSDEKAVVLYKFDIRSLLAHYQSIFSLASLQSITGINQRQLWHYAAGRSNPRPRQARKIVEALNHLGKELSSLSV